MRPTLSARSQGPVHWRKWLAAVALCLGTSAAAASEAVHVGLTRLTLGDVPVTLTYPTGTPSAPLRIGSFELDVAVDAEPAPGRRRLVVMSHGSGGSGSSDHTLAATLVRAGFVVAQPVHAGDNAADASRAGPRAWATRPQEVIAVLDALAAHPSWKDRLVLDRVGVHGISAGGLTALAVAGGRWRTLDLIRHCLAQGQADLGFCCAGAPDALARAGRRAQYEMTRFMPEFALPRALTSEQGGRDGPGDPRLDARIASVTVAVPVGAPLSQASLQRIQVPVGVVGAQRDAVLVPTWHSQRVLQHCRSCVELAALKDAGHFDLLSPWPADVAARVAATQVRGGMPEPAFEAAQRQRVFDAIAAFHRQHLAP